MEGPQIQRGLAPGEAPAAFRRVPVAMGVISGFAFITALAIMINSFSGETDLPTIQGILQVRPGIDLPKRDFVDFVLTVATFATCLLLGIRSIRPNAFEHSRWSKFEYGALLTIATIVTVTVFSQYLYVRERYCDVGDMFHYWLGPKYLSELGYTDLYIAVAVAQDEAGRETPQWMRDLRTNGYMRTADVLTEATSESVKSRFSPERWKAFGEDVEQFRHWHGRRGWQRRFTDHGYNGTPVWNLLAAFVTNMLPVSQASLTGVAVLNLAAVTAMFLFVLRAFGWHIGLLFTILFCVSFPDRYLLGGSILRYLWIAFLVTGLSFMKMRWYGMSGLFVSLSAMLVVFPVFFLLGIATKIAHGLTHGRRPRNEHLRFLSGAGLTCVLFVLLSCCVGQGYRNWNGFRQRMDLNSGRLASGRIGFIYNFIYPKEVWPEDRQQPYEPRLETYKAPKSLVFSWQNLATLVTVTVVVAILRLAGKVDDLALTILLGFALFFFLFSTVRYYYAGLLGLPLMWHQRMILRSGSMFVLALFLIQLVAYILSPYVIYCFLYNTWLSGAFSAYLVAGVIHLGISSSPTDRPSGRTCQWSE